MIEFDPVKRLHPAPGCIGEWISRCTVALALALLAFTTALAQEAAQEDEFVRPNFKDVDIRQIVESVSAVTGKNFLLDARVKGTVTMISESPMSPDAFYETFLSILQVYGFVAVPSGDVIKIIPDTNARQQPGAESGAAAPSGLGRDDIVTEVIQVDNVGAAQLVPILRPLVPQYGHLAAHPASNMLIISDRAANVKRLKRIIRRIDQSGDEDIEVIPLEHASSGEVVRILTTLNQATARGGDAAAAPLSLVPDERTNSVLISGDKATRLRFRTLIAHLDTPLEEGGNTQVIYLRYAIAEEFATKLMEQVRGTAATPQAGQAAQQQGNVNIWADPGTNALIITAPPKIMRSLRNVIDKIDIRRAQVHVEAILVEVTADQSAEFGITWAVDATNDAASAGLTNFGSAGTGVVQLGSTLAGDTSNIASSAGLIGDGITFGLGRISEGGTSFAMILRALAGDGNTNILSTPSVVTMDNQEAEISVGQEVPFLTGSFSNTGGTTGAVNPFQTIQRRDVGIKLKITPQINEGTAIILDINLEASSISQSSADAVDLITNQRTITQKVVVEDGGIIVLGGLIDDNLLESDQRVPVLSRIPGIGNLFRSRRTSKVKRNLMVFIRPKILRDGMQSSIATNQKYNYIRDLQLGQRDDVVLMPNVPRPALPPIEDYVEDRDSGSFEYEGTN